jgi:hypothetical protein
MESANSTTPSRRRCSSCTCRSRPSATPTRPSR